MTSTQKTETSCTSHEGAELARLFFPALTVRRTALGNFEVSGPEDQMDEWADMVVSGEDSGGERELAPGYGMG